MPEDTFPPVKWSLFVDTYVQNISIKAYTNKHRVFYLISMLYKILIADRNTKYKNAEFQEIYLIR